MLLWGKLKRMVWMKGGWVNWMKTEFSLNLRWIKIEYSKTYILFSLFSSSANMYLLRPSPWLSLFWMKKISKWEFLELPWHLVSSALFRYWCWGELSACTPEDHQIPRAIENAFQDLFVSLLKNYWNISKGRKGLTLFWIQASWCPSGLSARCTIKTHRRNDIGTCL